MAFAYVWQSGLIEFGEEVPDGALAIAKGERQELEDEVGCQARHAYDGVNLLVPGIPEAEDPDAMFGALHRFRKRVKAGLERAAA